MSFLQISFHRHICLIWLIELASYWSKSIGTSAVLVMRTYCLFLYTYMDIHIHILFLSNVKVINKEEIASTKLSARFFSL